MNIPIFEKPSSLMFFIGFGISLYICSYMIKSGEIKDEKDYDGKNKIVQLNCERKLDSIDVLMLQNKLAALNLDTIDPANSNNNNDEIKRKDIELQIAGKNILNNRSAQEIKIIRNNLKSISNQYEIDTNSFGVYFILSIAVFFIVMGVFLLEFETKEANSIKKGVSVKTGICQSCSMELKYDLSSDLEKEFCSTCYNGTSFIEPELTIIEIRKRIEENMKKRGFKDRVIKKHLKYVGTLNRWANVLRWK